MLQSLSFYLFTDLHNVMAGTLDQIVSRDDQKYLRELLNSLCSDSGHCCHMSAHFSPVAENTEFGVGAIPTRYRCFPNKERVR